MLELGKRMLNRSLVLSALMTLVVTGNVLAADLTLTTQYQAMEGKYNVLASPSQSDLSEMIPVGSGEMYYTVNSYSGNNFYISSDIGYHTGFLLAVGFHRDSSDSEASSERYIENNIMHIGDNSSNKRIRVTPNGGIEFTAGYFSKYAYGTATNNEINCENAEISTKGFLGLYGVFANQNKPVKDYKIVTVKQNKVNINNSYISANSRYLEVFGGYPMYGTATLNEVNINSSNFTALCDMKICGGFVQYAGDATSNTVAITGTEKNQTFIQNAANDDDIQDKAAIEQVTEIAGGYCMTKGNTEGNDVKIEFAQLQGSKIYGGYTANGNATNNTVTISNSNLTGSSLYGGYSDNEGQITDNTLNLGSNITGKLNAIGGFNTINFANIDWENGGTIIETENLELVDTAVNIQNITGDPKVNDYMNLIVSDNEITGKLINQGEQTVKVSAAQVVKATTGNLEQESNAIKFTIVGSELNPQVGALGDANAVAGAFVANGAGLVEDSINAMMCEERIGYKTFAQVYGSNLDFDTPNNLNVKGWSGIVGVGETTKDRITYGMFFETGKGDYYTLAQQSTGYVRGDGELDYRGGGVLVRKDNENGTYVEASLRAGRMDNELNDAVLDGHNELQGFDISSTYYGAHIGVGKIIPRGERESLDVYGKFLYSRYDGDSFVIDGDKFNLDDVDSQKLRVGFRYNELNGEKLRMYYGAAYEYEFDTKAKNSVLNYTFDSPDLGGSTIIGELGFHYNADEKWCIDVNLRGYGGEREGISGSVQANYMF